MINDIDHIIEKRNIVGNKDKSILIFLKIAFQPCNVFFIQIVGGLIQKKNIWFLQKQLGKEHLGTLSAAEICDITVKPKIQKTKCPGNLFYLGINYVEVVHGQGILDSSQFLHKNFHFFRGGFTKGITDGIHSFFQFKKPGKSRFQHVADGHARSEDRMLVQITYADIFCPLDPALIRHQFVSYNIEEGGFSLSVGAYQANMFSF